MRILHALLQSLEDARRARVLVIAGVGSQTDAPVFVAIPGVVEHVRFGLDVRVHGPVEVGVEPLAFRVGPPFETQVVRQRAQREVVAERDVAGTDRPVHQLERPLLGLAAQAAVALDDGNQRLRNDGGVVVRACLSRHGHHALILGGALLGQRLQIDARAEQARVLDGDGMAGLRENSGREKSDRAADGELSP